MQATTKHAPIASSQFLTFRLDQQEYGLPLLKIQEIRGYLPPTPIPNLPSCIKGVMNLRGTVLPVIGLREKFCLPAIEYNSFAVIVIVIAREKMVGLLVDSVSDVLDVPDEAIRPVPDFGSAVDTRFLSGMFQARDQLAVALNLEELLSDTSLSLPRADRNTESEV